MTRLATIEHIYFIGIGGIGMSALARYFHARGVRVSGYDKTETPLTKALAAAGMNIIYQDTDHNLPTDVQLVVYTPAVPKDQKAYVYYTSNNYQVVKRSDVLEIITEGSYNICIAGTHGKTTITTMTGHVLRDTGFGCNAFLGGIAANYNTNFWSDPRNVSVVEADEYDRSFLKLHPDIAVISAMDADHLDIYHTAEALEEAFIQFAQQRKSTGWIISKIGLVRHDELPKERHLTYGINNPLADIEATNIQMQDGAYMFDVTMKQPERIVLKGMQLNMGGMHNVENVLVAISIALLLGIEEEKIRIAVSNFKGVKRRFEYIVAPCSKEDTIYIDDYAHHPQELQALMTSVKALFPDKKNLLVFQPHLYSRTKDFAAGFAAALSLADEVYLLPIYPARELPMEGVTSDMLVGLMEKGTVISKEALLEMLQARKDQGKLPGVIITAGAGNIDSLVTPIHDLLK